MLQKLLIIQDLSCAGQVSLSSALPILGAAGFQPAVLPTALLSTHTGGWGKNSFYDLSTELTKIITHWSTIPLSFSNVYLGYLGESALSVILDQLNKVLSSNHPFILLDPVMGDHGKLYSGFSKKYPLMLSHLAKKASLLTPNLTEAELLLNRKLSSGTVEINYARQLVVELQRKFPDAAILLTGVSLAQQKVAVFGSENISREIWQLSTPRLPGNYFGTGDLFASALTAAILNNIPLKRAAEIAMEFININLKQRYAASQQIDLRIGLDYSAGLPLLLKQLKKFKGGLSMREKPNSLKSIIFTGLFAAIIYLGIFILRIPIPAMVGRPFIHFGNTLAALAVLFLGFRNGTLAGIIGLGGFDILNGYAATSWLTMLEVIIVASIIELLFRFFKYQDKQKQIAIIALAAGITKIFTSYCTSIIEALMIGTNFKAAIVASFLSLPATVINSISTAICVPILYFLIKRILLTSHFID